MSFCLSVCLSVYVEFATMAQHIIKALKSVRTAAMSGTPWGLTKQVGGMPWPVYRTTGTTHYHAQLGLLSLFIYQFIHLSFHLSTHVHMYVCNLLVYLFTYLIIYVTIYLSI